MYAFGANFPIESREHVRITMHDGVRLDTNVFYPAGANRWPAILIRTPYGHGAGLTPNNRAFVEHG
jgi:predicted acyl esterase